MGFPDNARIRYCMAGRKEIQDQTIRLKLSNMQHVLRTTGYSLGLAFFFLGVELILGHCSRPPVRKVKRPRKRKRKRNLIAPVQDTHILVVDIE